MTEPQLTPEALTFKHIQKWDAAEMRNQMAHPEMRNAIINLLKNRSLSEVEQLANPQNPPPATDATVIVFDPATEGAAKAAEEAARIAAEEAAKPKVFSVDYQVRDEKGNPIGRPTHLEAPTEEGLRAKLIEAHTQATRAFHRLKEQKTTFKQPTQSPVHTEKISDDELKQALNDIRSEDPKVSAEAQAKITLEERRKAQEAQRLYLEEQASYAFLRKHIHDFNNCEANVKMIDEYIKENKLEWTLDNLELAFIAKESELAPVVQPVAPVTPANPAPAVSPVVTTPAVPVAVQPVVPAPAAPAVPNNPAPAVPKPGVNGGVVPGESSGIRPPAKPTGLTAEEIRSWDGATMRKNMANPAMRAQIEAFVAARNAQRGK